MLKLILYIIIIVLNINIYPNIFYRYLREWAEYKKTDAYKEFRKQQVEQKDVVPKKVKHSSVPDSPIAGLI